MRATVLILLSLVLTGHAALAEQTLRFAGYEWSVKEGFGGPGPNHWDARNAFIDEQGHLHLKLTQHDGQWFGAEITLNERIGFGRYEWQIVGLLNRLDANVVLGLFNYTTPDIGPDGTNEIDIEFARWGNPKQPSGNYTVWPAEKGAPQHGFKFALPWDGDQSNHSFEWAADSILFQSMNSPADPQDKRLDKVSYLFRPAEPLRSIPQHPLPVHFNLWLFHGQPPKNGQEVEIVIESFHFTPAPVVNTDEAGLAPRR